MKWTDEQQQVIDSRNSNLLVAAAAGSGKTAVLVERLVGRVVPESEGFKKEDYTDIDRMLVVTFTRDAAAELRERVDKALDKRLADCTSEVIADVIYRQKSLLAKSYITTIDSFCMDVVKQNFIQLGIDASFTIGENADLEILADDILSDILEEYYAEKDPVFLRVVDTYMKKNSDVSFKETILKIYNFAQNDVNPAAWIEQQKENYSAPETFNLRDSVWGAALSEYFIDLVTNSYNEYLLLQDMCVNYGVVGYKNCIDNEAAAFESLLQKLRTDNPFDVMANLDMPLFCKSIGQVKTADKTVFSDSVQTRRKSLKENFEVFCKSFFNGADSENHMKILSADVFCMCDIVSKFQKRLLEEKNSRRIFSFNDIAHFALELLTTDCRKEGRGFVPTDVAERYQKLFDEIYIDEYQDTSIIQEILLNSVAGRGTGAHNVFMVGDIKQSIYGFRHACPEFFLEKYNSYEEKECDNRLICLYKNFRSRKNVVNGANDVFSKIMSKATAEMDYTEKEYLNYGASYYDDDEKSAVQSSQKCEIVLVGKEPESDDSGLEKVDSHEIQARYIAGRILDMISSGYEVFDTSVNAMRKVKFSDFVILMRNTSSAAPKYAEVLNLYGIPVFAAAEKRFYSTPEISTILSFIKIIDNPHQDIPLMSVMRSPLFGFTDGDIALIKIAQKYADLYDSCTFFAKKDYSEQPELEYVKNKLSVFFERLKELRELSKTVTVYDLVWIIANENNFYNEIGLYEDGESSRANIRMLLDAADSFDNNGGQGLFRFIRNIQRLENENKKIEEASVCSESANVVRIKTIHKSKGLEFPVVFLAEADKQPGGGIKEKSTAESARTLLLHRRLGINPMCYESGKYVSVTYPSVMRNITEIIMKKERIAEEMRLLYVAITRAREKFIAVGAGDSKVLNKYEGQGCSTLRVLERVYYLDWLLMSTEDSECWEKTFVPCEDAYNYPDDMFCKVDSQRNDLQKECSDAEDFELVQADDSRMLPAGDVIPVKISVSDIKRIHASKDEESDIEDFFVRKHGVAMRKIDTKKDKSQKRTFTHAEKGTLAHTCLQLFDFERCKKISGISEAETYVDEFLKKMLEDDVFDADEVKAVERKILVKFIMSDIGKRIFSAEKVYRETPFTVRMKWCEISGEKGDFGDDEYVSVQGVIDCFIVEDDGCTVIDYKTDYINSENAAAVDEAYKIQIKCYSDAIEKITGRKVKESKIVYLRNL